MSISFLHYNLINNLLSFILLVDTYGSLNTKLFRFYLTLVIRTTLVMLNNTIDSHSEISTDDIKAVSA